MNRIHCQIYRSPKKPETYLYVEKSRGLADVPEVLLQQFGEPEEVMSLLLDAQRQLARADAADVLKMIAQQGFYLQMPPTTAELLRREGQGD